TISAATKNKRLTTISKTLEASLIIEACPTNIRVTEGNTFFNALHPSDIAYKRNG
ncbi:MAG: hypothetical protein ACI9P7_000907, partial [Candidatus Azotimanducaceae bacterium]